MQLYLVQIIASRVGHDVSDLTAKIEADVLILAGSKEEKVKSHAADIAVQRWPDNEGWQYAIYCRQLSTANVKELSKLCNVVLPNTGPTEPRVLAFSTGQRVEVETAPTNEPDSVA